VGTVRAKGRTKRTGKTQLVRSEIEGSSEAVCEDFRAKCSKYRRERFQNAFRTCVARVQHEIMVLFEGVIWVIAIWGHAMKARAMRVGQVTLSPEPPFVG